MSVIYWLIGYGVLVNLNCVESKEHEFNRDQTGVIFSPYVKNWNNESIPNWKNYTMKDVIHMLEVISTKFTHISTYGMGAGVANAKWNEADAVGLTAVAAAQVNRKNRNVTISVVEGIWHNNDPALYNQEITNAFEAAKEANAKFPKTVTGIVLSSFSWMNWFRSWKDTIKFLQENRETATGLGLRIGLRLDICGEIIPPKLRPEDENGLHSAATPAPNANTTKPPPPLLDIQVIARNADILICTIFPPANVAAEGTNTTVRTLGKQMFAIGKALKIENKELTVTWETGWPSHGVSRFGSENSNRNLRNYWVQFDEWAKSTNSKLYMFAAFDEPWKINPRSDKELTDPEGPNGAESHFGWWSLRENEDITSLLEKEPEPEPEKPSTGLSGGAVAGIILGILIPIILILIWWLYKARQTIERLTEEDIKEFVEGIPIKGNAPVTGDTAMHLPYDRSYELSLDAIVIDEGDVLGSGAFGIVYKGKIKGIAEPVAFKKPNKNISVSQLKNLLGEIKIMIYIGKHENVVVLLGAHTDGIRDGVVYIASEICTMGSLESHLRSIPRTFTAVEPTDGGEVEFKNPELEVRYVNHVQAPIENSVKPRVPIPSMLRWSFEIANGMEYLASRKVIHADLATRNVLLTAEGTAKITDFGLSRRLYEYTQYVKSNNQEPLPWRWMAIESLRNLSFSSLSDVWSYGITLWEIFTLGDLPYPGLSWNVSFVDQLEQGLRMHMPKYATVSIYNDTMIRCWHINPEARPTFTDLKHYFHTLAYEEGKLGSHEYVN